MKPAYSYRVTHSRPVHGSLCQFDKIIQPKYILYLHTFSCRKELLMLERLISVIKRFVQFAHRYGGGRPILWWYPANISMEAISDSERVWVRRCAIAWIICPNLASMDEPKRRVSDRKKMLMKDKPSGHPAWQPQRRKLYISYIRIHIYSVKVWRAGNCCLYGTRAAPILYKTK